MTPFIFDFYEVIEDGTGIQLSIGCRLDDG